MNTARTAALLLLFGCGGVVQRADELPPPPPGYGFLQIVCEPGDVDVFVDGRFSGRLDGYPEGVVRLPAGEHRVRLGKSGYYSWYGVVQAGPSAARVRARLVAEPPLEP